MQTNFELMDLHARALYTHDSRSKLLFVNEPGEKTLQAARMFLGRTRASNLWRFRADLPTNLCEELAALCAKEPIAIDFTESPHYVESYVRLLEQHAPVSEFSGGPAYRFTEIAGHCASVIAVTEENAGILQNGFEDFVAELPDWQPFVALVEDNHAVSVCRSARITPEAHEAGVETLSDFRGRGFAAKVTTEWARLVQAAGAMPLYSTDWDNFASQSVARKLSLRFFGADFNIS